MNNAATKSQNIVIAAAKTMIQTILSMIQMSMDN